MGEATSARRVGTTDGVTLSIRVFRERLREIKQHEHIIATRPMHFFLFFFTLFSVSMTASTPEQVVLSPDGDENEAKNAHFFSLQRGPLTSLLR